MDFKNFIDVLSTPKNIGSNKWVLNNFSDLKSSNDYLHIIRLRYDNRWLRIYWDGKLKEVEKDFNFYVSTPVKGKLFLTTPQNTTNFSLLTSDFFNMDGDKNISTTRFKININDYFTKKVKKKIEDGEFRSNYYLHDFYNFYYNSKNNYSLDNNFLDYRLGKGYYLRNIKNSIKNLDEINSESNLWLLNRNNSVSRVYPNLNKILLAGNLLIGSKESEGGFNTNLVSIRNPS